MAIATARQASPPTTHSDRLFPAWDGSGLVLFWKGSNTARSVGRPLAMAACDSRPRMLFVAALYPCPFPRVAGVREPCGARHHLSARRRERQRVWQRRYRTVARAGWCRTARRGFRSRWLAERDAIDLFAALRASCPISKKLDLRLSVVVWQFSIFRHRHHPHGAERGHHRDIHDDPHGLIPDFLTVSELRSLAGVSGASVNPEGVALRQRRKANTDCGDLLEKSDECGMQVRMAARLLCVRAY